MNGADDKIIADGILDYLSKSEVFMAKLMQKQTPNGYWSASGDNFYDTGFVLLPFSGDSIEGKEKTISWLLSSGVQDKDGCWKGNILNTALLLYSVWPRQIAQAPTSSPKPSCESAGNFCLSPIDCTENAGGTVLSEYTCDIASKSCCSKDIRIGTCPEKGGEICNSNQDCVGGVISTVSGLSSGEKCCVGGSCKEKEEESECEKESGFCVGQSYGCGSDEEEVGYLCSDIGKVCCKSKDKKTEDEEKSGLWIWILILIILIVIVALLIIFRDRLRPYWLKIKNSSKKKGDGKPGQPVYRGPGIPPSSSSAIPQRGLPVRRFPPQQTQSGAGSNRFQSFPNQQPPQRGPIPQQRVGPQGIPPQRDNRTNEAIDKLKEMNR
jgi:hypothetical protein